MDYLYPQYLVAKTANKMAVFHFYSLTIYRRKMFNINILRIFILVIFSAKKAENLTLFSLRTTMGGGNSVFIAYRGPIFCAALSNIGPF